MGTTTDKLNHLIATKEAIKKAIVAKGVSVANTDTFRSYADKIGEIQSGGGESSVEYWRFPEGYSLNDSEVLVFAHLVRIIGSQGENEIAGSFLGSLNDITLVAMAYDNSLKFMVDGQEFSFRDVFPPEAMESYGFTKISREEFYDTNI